MCYRSGLNIEVSNVDELFAICDALKERINESQVTQLNLTDMLVDEAVDLSRSLFFSIILAGKLKGKRDHNFPKNNRRCGGRSVITTTTTTNTQNKLFAICETSMDSRSPGYLDLVGRFVGGWGGEAF